MWELLIGSLYGVGPTAALLHLAPGYVAREYPLPDPDVPPKLLAGEMQHRSQMLWIWGGWAWVLAAVWLVGLILAVRLVKGRVHRVHSSLGLAFALSLLIWAVVRFAQERATI